MLYNGIHMHTAHCTCTFTECLVLSPFRLVLAKQLNIWSIWICCESHSLTLSLTHSLLRSRSHFHVYAVWVCVYVGLHIVFSLNIAWLHACSVHAYTCMYSTLANSTEFDWKFKFKFKFSESNKVKDIYLSFGPKQASSVQLKIFFESFPHSLEIYIVQIKFVVDLCSLCDADWDRGLHFPMVDSTIAFHIHIGSHRHL